MKASEPKTYPASWPNDMTAERRAEIEKRMSAPVVRALHGGDERLNRRVLVRVTPNYVTYVNGPKPEHEQNHELQINGTSVWYRYNEWCALPLAAVEILTRRYDHVSMKFVPAPPAEDVDVYEGGRNEIVKHKKFTVAIWEEDSLPFRPWMPDAKDREKKAAA